MARHATPPKCLPAAPCSVCGTTGGPWKGNTHRPVRLSLVKWGGTGVGCATCYETTKNQFRRKGGPTTMPAAPDPFADVLEFHRELLPHLVGSTPADPLDGRAALRDRLIAEEARELSDAMLASDPVQVADAVADVIYIALGIATAWGIDMAPVWAEVHRSNMAKKGGPIRADGKQLKPPGWTPPDVAGVLARQGTLGEGTR